MNATLQCFINVDPLTRYLLTDNNYYAVMNNNSSYELSSAYCYLLANVCSDDTIRYFSPRLFKEVISPKNPLFEGVNANDSKDLIKFMLEEMNQVLSKLNRLNGNNNMLNVYSITQVDQTNRELTFNKYKNYFIKGNYSIIAQIFFFIMESTTQCQGCNLITYNYQSLFLLEFPLESVFNYFLSKKFNLMNYKGEIVINLMHCLEHFRSPTFFTGDNQFYCNGCKRLMNTINTNNIYSLPPYLIMIYNRGKGKSFKCVVEFPEYLNLSNYVLSNQSICNYQLCGVITHFGQSGMSGHFIAFCRHRIDNLSYCYNDSKVERCSNQQNKFIIGSPYILFYRANNDNRPNHLFSNLTPLNNNNNFNNMNQNTLFQR